jgi:hypothetical protein
MKSRYVREHRRNELQGRSDFGEGVKHFPTIYEISPEELNGLFSVVISSLCCATYGSSTQSWWAVKAGGPLL